jgi:hypothetical protein
LLEKIVQKLGGTLKYGETQNSLLAKILSLVQAPTVVEDIVSYFNKVDEAYVGGNQTGNTRGAFSLDIQSDRTMVTQVASGTHSVCLGYSNTASAGYFMLAIGALNNVNSTSGTALGTGNTVSAGAASAIGSGNTASGVNAAALGTQNSATGLNTNALGVLANARVPFTTNICPPIINRKDNGEPVGSEYSLFCGTEVVLLSKEVDLEVAADQTVTLPAGCHFFPNEVGVWVTSLNALATQPTVRFGWTGAEAGLIVAGITTALTAAYSRERYTTLVTSAGQTSLVAGVTIGGSATTLLGRFYWKGMLIEDE